ncbi:hypothetical protein GCM10025867_47040 (plasmid) [Frondihabitans sucicola]|uniref:Uncharacterized protein n=1 Tax=Frondihabitans sucicola TaxID=1268041 RepID=A0ABM8GVG4_9MICO|nr:hypothetical protein [Frondihabitans sucicola]BDZ52463.1 hypothetical protein GCM10025867_47040 [Frondihabitans sucicola]
MVDPDENFMRRYNAARADLGKATALLGDIRTQLQGARRSGNDSMIATLELRVADREAAVEDARHEWGLSHFLMMTDAERRTSLRRRIEALEANPALQEEAGDLQRLRATADALDAAALNLAALRSLQASPVPDGADGIFVDMRGDEHEVIRRGNQLLVHDQPIDLPYFYAPGISVRDGHLTLRAGLVIELHVIRDAVGAYDIERTLLDITQ